VLKWRPLARREKVTLRTVDAPASVDPSEALSRPVAIAIGLLLTLAAASTLRDFYLPGKELTEIRKRDFAAWFWSGMERGHEVLCLAESLPPTLPSLSKAGQGSAAPDFLCHQRIYSPQHIEGKACDLDQVSNERPLACVQYWSHLAPYDPAAFARWLDAMQQSYTLIASARYPLLQDEDNDRQPEPADRVEVYEFVPRR